MPPFPGVKYGALRGLISLRKRSASLPKEINALRQRDRDFLWREQEGQEEETTKMGLPDPVGKGSINTSGHLSPKKVFYID